MIKHESAIICRQRYYVMDYLRSFLIMLIVLYHSILSYTSFNVAEFTVDFYKFNLFNLVTNIIDISCVPALFFISGLFVWEQLERDGISKFILKRIKRLAIPFFIGYTCINSIGNYMAKVAYVKYCVGQRVEVSFSSFLYYWLGYFGSEKSAGHLWFLFMLLIFNLIMAAVYKVFAKFTHVIRESEGIFFKKTFNFFKIFIIVLMASYIPLINLEGGKCVNLFNIANIQMSKVLVYFIYYMIGNMIGIYGLEKSVLNEERWIVKKWWVLACVSGILYEIYTIVDINNLYTSYFIKSCIMIIIGLCMTFSFYGFFTRFIKKTNPISHVLSCNSYGVYIIHYPVVVGIQYIFMNFDIHGSIKGIGVFIISLVLSNIIVSLLKKINVINNIVG